MPSSEVMDKFKAGTLHSGGPGGKVVANPKQAVAIKLSEQRKEKANGGHYPEGRSPGRSHFTPDEEKAMRHARR